MNPREALEKLAQYCEETGAPPEWEDWVNVIERALNERDTLAEAPQMFPSWLKSRLTGVVCFSYEGTTVAWLPSTEGEG